MAILATIQESGRQDEPMRNPRRSLSLIQEVITDNISGAGPAEQYLSCLLIVPLYTENNCA